MTTPAPAASFTSGLPADDVSACGFDGATVGDVQSWNGSGRGGQFLTPSSSLNAKRGEGTVRRVRGKGSAMRRGGLGRTVLLSGNRPPCALADQPAVLPIY